MATFAGDPRISIKSHKRMTSVDVCNRTYIAGLDSVYHFDSGRPARQLHTHTAHNGVIMCISTRIAENINDPSNPAPT